MVSRHFRKYVLIIAVSCFISIGTSLYAQQVEISSSLNPVGSGARATGMGGAFIGVADDATAASWNPAGLIQLEKPEISAVYSYFDREHTYSSAAQPEIASTNTVDTDGLNYASIVYPFVLFNRNMVISFNYQRLFEMDKNNKFILNKADSSSDSGVEVADITFVQDGYLYTLSPAMAVQLTPELYIGGTINFWDNFTGQNGWKNTYKDVGTASVSGFTRITDFTQTQDISFEGTNAHIGFMWLITDSLTLGGVYKTAFDADISRSNYRKSDRFWPTIPPFPFTQPGTPATSTEELTMKMPASYGLGLAYRHSDAWTVAFDVYRTEWEDFFIIDSMGNRSNPLDNSSDPMKSTTQVRLGTEYLFIRNKYVVPVRAGLFYDPEPAVGHLDDYYGFSVGGGYARGRVVVDMSYQYRTGDNVSPDIPGVSGASADVQQHALLFSTILYFE
jgi:long-subunit fatty acid transport protein